MFSLANAKAVVIGLGLATVSAFAGDKIQFSKPAEPAPTAPAREVPGKASPSLFDSYRSGNAPSPLNFTPVTPSATISEKPEREKKDWIFARPEDGLTIEKALKIDEDSTAKKESFNKSNKSLSSYVQQLEAEESARRAAREGSLEANGNAFDSRLSGNENALDLGRSALESNGRLQNDQTTSVTEYLKDLRSPERERLEDLSLARRAEFEQIFQSRNNVIASTDAGNQGLNPLDAARQTANPGPVTISPTDLLNRTGQTTFSDPANTGYQPLTGTRSSALEDVNARALGRTESSPLNTPTQTLRIQPQPAVLPFPQRPGSLFNR